MIAERPWGPEPDERLQITSDGAPVPFREIDGGHGGRVHVCDAPVGRLLIDYDVRVDGLREVPHGGESDLLEYRRLVDATRLAPRPSLLRIATGRDAAFMTTHFGAITVTVIEVTATADPCPSDLDAADVVVLR